jgi:hypothetical protein
MASIFMAEKEANQKLRRSKQLASLAEDGGDIMQRNVSLSCELLSIATQDILLLYNYTVP